MNKTGKKINNSDKDWINGYFEGEYAGQEKLLMETIRILKKKLRKIRKQKASLEIKSA